MIDVQRPVVFLDFDGVLNHAGLVVAHGKHHRKFDRMCCELVLKLGEVVGAQVVISSAWREGLTVAQLRRMIEVQGDCWVPPELIIGTTPGGIGTRGSQVARWRADNAHTGRYVAIDDFDDFLPEQKPHVVLTSALRGFGFIEFAAALLILDPASPLLREIHHHIDDAQRLSLDWGQS